MQNIFYELVSDWQMETLILVSLRIDLGPDDSRELAGGGHTEKYFTLTAESKSVVSPSLRNSTSITVCIKTHGRESSMMSEPQPDLDSDEECVVHPCCWRTYLQQTKC